MAKTKTTLTPPQKLLKILRIFRRGLDAYEKEEPEWRRVTLVQLVKESLFNLRHYLECPDSPVSTWNNPRVRLNYAVQWDWPEKISSRRLGRPLSLTLDSSDLDEKERLVEKCKVGLLDHARLTSLDEITHNTLRVWKGGSCVTAVAGGRLRVLNSVSEPRQAELLELLRAPVRLSPDQRSFPEVPKDLINQEFWQDPIDLSFAVTLNGGSTINGKIEVAIHLLELVLDERTSSYPIEIGLKFYSQVSPDTWSGSDIDSFWKQLHERCDAVVKHERQRPVRQFAITLANSLLENSPFFECLRTELNRNLNNRSEHFLKIPIVSGMADLFEGETQAHALRVKGRAVAEGRWPDFLKDPVHDDSNVQDRDNHQIGDLKASPDFRTFTFRREKYFLTPSQCEIVRVLWIAHKSGQAELSEKHIMKKVNRSTTDRMWNVFRSRRDFFEAFIHRGNPGVYSLKIPD